MAKTYKYATDLEGPDGNEHDVSVTYQVCWGTPETGRGYMADPYKYDPGSPDVVEDVKIQSVDGGKFPSPELAAFLIAKIDVDELLTAATEAELSLADAEADCRRRWA